MACSLTKLCRNTHRAHTWTSNFYQLPQLAGVLYATPVHIWCYTSPWDLRYSFHCFTIAPTETPLMSAPQATFHVCFFFFKVKCYIYCSIYVFCNQLTPGKLCFQVFFPYLSFCVSMMKFLSVAPLIPLLPKPCAFYGEILRSEGIFRFNRNDLWGL